MRLPQTSHRFVPNEAYTALDADLSASLRQRHCTILTPWSGAAPEREAVLPKGVCAKNRRGRTSRPGFSRDLDQYLPVLAVVLLLAERLASTASTCLSYVRPTLSLANHMQTHPPSPCHERGRGGEGERGDGGTHTH